MGDDGWTSTVVTGPAQRSPSAAWIAGIALAYIACGWLGMAVAVQQVSAVWASSGLALAAVLLIGPRALIGVGLGSFLLNFSYGFDASRPLSCAAVAAALAAGATVEALVGWTLVHRYARGLRFLDRAVDIFRFVGLAGLLAPVIAATVGTLALSLAGGASIGGAVATWWTWWIGDVAGILAVTPFVLAWSRDPGSAVESRGWGEVLGVAVSVVAVASVAFVAGFPVEALAIPCLVWAAFRFGLRGASSLTLLLAVIAIAGTLHGRGTFAHLPRGIALLFLQAFVGVIAVASLVLCAVIEERASRTRALLRARDEAQTARAAAEEANRAKTMFLATASHELRTPLNHIIGYGEMLEEDARTEGRAAAAADLGKILRSAKDLLAVVSSILDMARLEAGTIEIEYREFEVGPVVEEVKAACAPLAEKNRNALSARVAEGGGRLKTDRAKVRQALLHLVDNACKFTRDGAVSVEARREESEGRAWTTFAVTDTGIGITPQQLVGLFRPFVQADGTATREYGGLGLSLAIARQFARKMGGDITVESTPGKGSTFRMRIPE